MNVLIVDDERMTREALKDFIPWKELGFDKILLAKNGLEGLKFIQLEYFDLILCDVKMPQMDGIELAQEIRKFNNDSTILFLSGYPEKEYLKSAIRLQAIDFIEKPLDFNEIKQVVEKIVADKKLKENASTNATEAIKNLEYLKPIHRLAFLTDIIQGKMDDRKIQEKYGAEIFQQFCQSRVRVGIVSIKNTGDSNIYRANDLMDLGSKLNDLDPSLIITSPISPDSLCFLIRLVETAENTSFETLLKRVIECCENNLATEAFFHIGFAPSCQGSSAIIFSVEKAFQSTKYVFYHPSEKVFYYKIQKNNPIDFDADLKKEWTNALVTENTMAAGQILQQLIHRCQSNQDIDIDHVKNEWIEIMKVLLDKVPGWSPSQSVMALDVGVKELKTAVSLNEIADIILNRLNRYFFNDGKLSLIDHRIDLVKRFIAKNYNNYDLTIENIAANVDWSVNYLSTVFKQITGNTIKDYLTNYRIEKAKEVLRDSGLCLHQVASQVGFRDPNYFGTVFRKSTGVTPGHFRRSCL